MIYVVLIIAAVALATSPLWLPALNAHWLEGERKARARCRQQDIEILWPALCDHAETIEHARLAFGHHAHNDPAWTADYNELEIYVIIQTLQAPS